MKRLFVLFCLIACATASAQLVTVDEVKGKMDKGEYKEALTSISTALGNMANPYTPDDTYQFLMYKAEAMLQLKNGRMAASVFGSAAKAATNAPQFAAARANAMLLNKCMGTTYSPGFGQPAIDILPIESRKQAMTAMWKDMWARSKQQVMVAMNAESLPPIEAVFQPLADMWSLEVTATGEGTETMQPMKTLGDRAYNLIDREISRCARRVQQLENAANSYDDFGGVGNWGGGRRGLSSPERKDLQDIMGTLAKIRDRAHEYRGIAARLGGRPERWDSLWAKASDALDDAEGVLNLR